MKQYKKVITTLVLGLTVGLFSASAMAWWGPFPFYHPWHHHWHHHYYDHGANDLAAGLVVGGVAGIVAGAAIASANQPPAYSQTQTCYQTKYPVWRHHFCNDNGCYVKTKWGTRTVCNTQ